MRMPVASTHQLTLRRYRPDDAEAARAMIMDAILRGAADHFTESQRTAWARTETSLDAFAASCSPASCWIAQINEQLVGFVDLLSVSKVSRLYVHPDHTRKGIGKSLLDEVEREARASNMLWLTAHANPIAESLLLREGYLVTSRRTVRLGPETLPVAIMEKLLEPVG